MIITSSSTYDTHHCPTAHCYRGFVLQFAHRSSIQRAISDCRLYPPSSTHQHKHFSAMHGLYHNLIGLRQRG
ncbi:predicted protein [Lichtheimia corymbifera JMRC:FSU:9682]|uniref:Uncharacterized protein n=1 Tax=Lichtheimia corymbifera JMRC:FSU:9682 TaxID=1263082 RepID=A0A068RYG4_9FUNG|nr:predicted protein [Lichtheimia corymbifera JMRC:FSU:9682]